ncbi:MAG: NHL repeat-containing protein [Actinobacteria bacterium]|nr:NHL repeat-containing protein [Actinomycetota bacterium]
MTDTVAENPPAAQSPEVVSRRGRRILGLVLAALLLLLGLATFLLLRLLDPPGDIPATEELLGIEWVRSIYGMSVAPEDQFQRTAAAAPGPDGSIHITDAQHGAIMRFTPDGRYIETFRGPEADPLVVPGRLTVGPDGLIYVVETQNDRVRVLNPDGSYIGTFSVPRPVSIAVSEDKIVVGSVNGFAILDPTDGSPVRVIGSRGQADYQFDYVHGVAIGEDGRIFVADSFNNRISAYDAEGNRLWIVRTGKPSNRAEMIDGRLTVRELEDQALTGEEALQLPLGMTLDGAGRIVVADMFECALAVFDPEDGSLIGKYGTPGPEDGKFFYPTNVSYDPQRDWFTVSDTQNNRVQIVRLPDSAGGGDAAAAARRVLDGPIRACAIPLALVIIAVGVALFLRRKRNQATSTTPSPEILDRST